MNATIAVCQKAFSAKGIARALEPFRAAVKLVDGRYEVIVPLKHKDAAELAFNALIEARARNMEAELTL